MKKALWNRLREYQFDDMVPPHLMDHVAELFGSHDASTRAFAGKLSRKLGWSTRFGLRAIDEYKKYLFLGVTADTPVTPSKVIDQVWHEHLLFTRAYRTFCRDVLEHEFDHHPELVPTADQTDAFARQYDQTLHRYVDEFNRQPPADIWGTPKFGPLPARRSAAEVRAVHSDGGGELALYAQYDGHDGGPSHYDLPEFGGGGEFSGGGGGDSWGDSDGDSDGGSGGDSGGDGGGSGCSSSCGGGCGGD